MTSPFDARQIEVLESLREIFSGCRMVVIGASALACSIELTWRKTGDVDLVVVTERAHAASSLRQLGFTRHPKVEHRWLAPNGLPVDILPITEADLQGGELIWPESGSRMSLAGLDVALRATFDVPLRTGSIPVATLPSVVLLKMAAWLDSPFARGRDLADIGHALSSYLAPDDMRRWDDARLAEVEFDDQSALALAFDLHATAGSAHVQVVMGFLDRVESSAFALDALARATSSAGLDPHDSIAIKLALVRTVFARAI